jgi:hypothetical protein
MLTGKRQDAFGDSSHSARAKLVKQYKGFKPTPTHKFYKLLPFLTMLFQVARDGYRL